jgi:hypothetical protein
MTSGERTGLRADDVLPELRYKKILTRVSKTQDYRISTEVLTNVDGLDLLFRTWYRNPGLPSASVTETLNSVTSPAPMFGATEIDIPL